AYAGNILKYPKIGVFQEVNGETEHKVVFVPGTVAGAFKIGGLRLGIVIFRDPALGVLVNKGETVDIQLVISAGMNIIPKCYALSEGGVIIHADSQPDAYVSPVFCEPPSRVKDTLPTSTPRLKVFKIDMPKMGVGTSSFRGAKLE